MNTFNAGDIVTVNERAAAISRFARFKDVAGEVKRRGRTEHSYHVKFDSAKDTVLLYQDELILLTDARIIERDNRIKELESIVAEVACLNWKEDYVGIESTNVQVMFPCSLIIQARKLLNIEAENKN